MAPDIKIHNESRETIDLIAFSRPNGVDLQSEFDVRKSREILAGQSEIVKPKDYDISHTGPGSQIYMLFRPREILETVKPQPGERVFLYTSLAKQAEWKLRLDGKRQVKDGPGSAVGQAPSKAIAAGSRDAQLGELKEQVKNLKKDLLERIEAIEKLLD